MKAKISLFLFLGLIFPLLIGAVGAPANLDNAMASHRLIQAIRATPPCTPSLALLV